jgi:hypothetical protein
MSSRAAFIAVGCVFLVVLIVSRLFLGQVSVVVARSINPLAKGQQREAKERRAKQIFRLLLPAMIGFVVLWIILVSTSDQF